MQPDTENLALVEDKERDNPVEAQDVIDALRLAFMAQKDSEKRAALADALIEMAPETDADRGITLLLELIAEGSLKVEVIE